MNKSVYKISAFILIASSILFLNSYFLSGIIPVSIDSCISRRVKTPELSESAARLKQIRKLLDLTQEEFAPLLGISQGYLSHLEMGTSPMQEEILERANRILQAQNPSLAKIIKNIPTGSEISIWSGVYEVSKFRDEDGRSFTKIVGDSVTIIDDQTGKIVGSEETEEDYFKQLICSIRHRGRGDGDHDVVVYQDEDGMWHTRVMGDSVAIFDEFGREVGRPGSGYEWIGSGYQVTRYHDEDGHAITRIVGDSVTEIDEFGVEVGRPGSGHEWAGSGYEITRYHDEDGHAITRIVGDSVTEIDHTTGRVIGRDED